MVKKHSIKVIRYENQLKNNWDSFVNEAKNGTFLFQRNFMEYHKDKLVKHIDKYDSYKSTKKLK